MNDNHRVTEPTKRLCLDLPSRLHTRFKSACVNTNRKMTTELLAFVEQRVVELENESKPLTHDVIPTPMPPHELYNPMNYTSIGDAPIDLVFSYSYTDNTLGWKERPAHWFENKETCRAWNSEYANREVEDTYVFLVTGVKKHYVLRTKNIVELFHDHQYDQTIASVADSVLND